ncbi:murein DD-endopeptidase MepM/ murein hydrolase activator NlpD [Kribbella aluminosa]|uniref:Murein DD-endopeptidase MepM/ murein hydrolase activator NlpD n=1 Tax=Kribbella aluminosa TaxID=416017 RepID=A0ABS4UK52_9ACTN|nr:M23 family peptidase [Kribbella aluminosa]MBP2352027.1 murein DD-endopeptidase MepM/ murein hydrolase activator NlpD [Kribbella aluminosa]
MPSKLSLRTTVATLAIGGLLLAAPPATASSQLSTSPTQASVAGVTLKLPSAVAGTLGAGSKSLVDTVAADVLSRSHDAKGLAPAVAVGKLSAQGRKVVVDVRTATTGWARGVAYVEAPRTAEGSPEGWLYIARNVDGRWVAGLEGDRTFATYVATSPLVGQAERQTMTAYADHKANATAANTGDLLLPWMPDYYMNLTGGPHANDGATGYWSSLDFSGGNASGRVRSSGSGTATSMCGAGGGWTRVIHPNGFSTDYYHMWNATYYNATPVGSSALLGNIGMDTCAGGSATGAHVHWSLRTYDANYNGTYTWLNGRTIGGWTWWNGSSQYTGCATRLGVTACPGNDMYNRVS